MRHRPDRMLERLAVCGHKPRRERRRAGERNLLAEHGADRDLVWTGVARHAPPGSAPHDLPDQFVVAERVDDRRRIGVEVEQAPSRRHRGVEIVRTLQPKPGFDIVVAAPVARA